jgi:post-segregation antitoxin (ccd killing protein)
MKQFTEVQKVMISKIQKESLNKLRQYDVNVSKFIRSAIKEKIKRDWPKIKEKKERVKLPF